MFSKKIKIISSKLGKIEHLKKFSSYIDKKVYSKSGEYLGQVKDLLFRKDCFLGIMLDRKNIFIGKEFFFKESEKGIILKIEPVTSLIGKQVFDSIGKKVGTVSDIKRKTNSNSYTDLMVKKAIYRKAVSIPKKDVDIAKKNIILKKEYDI